MTVTLDFEDIKQRVNISSVLSQYANVPDAHRSTYRIPCPLHSGEGKNFKVDDERGLFWCHTCHKGGDVIFLLSCLEGITQSEAASKLMAQHGLQAADSLAVTFRKMTRQMQWMEEKQSPPALSEGQIPVTHDLFSYRCFSRKAIDHFGLRVIPGEGWGTGVYIPIRKSGELVGYSIRHSDLFIKLYEDRVGHAPPKYLNTEGLAKQVILYGLSENLESIEEAGFVYLVEGQFDCIAMWDKGYRNVVATMGSHLSVLQARQLMELVGRIVLVFDGDNAGREAMSKITKQYNSLFTITTVHLPEGEDPATADLRSVI